MTVWLSIVMCVVLASVTWAMLAFNRLIRLRNQVRTAWADVDVQLMRRHDLVPMLVAAVQAYAAHERALLETVAELRTRAANVSNPSELGDIETALQSGIVRLLALQEAYPDLKASDHFATLQRDLVSVEEQLQYARRFYNGAVRNFNDAAQRMPDLLIARMLGFADAEFFQTVSEQRVATKLELPQ